MVLFPQILKAGIAETVNSMAVIAGDYDEISTCSLLLAPFNMNAAILQLTDKFSSSNKSSTV